MTPNTSKALSDIFDVELTNTDKSIEVLKIEATNNSIDSLETQRNYVKKNIVSLIEKGNQAMDEMMAVAKSTEDGKDYKVVIEMVKVLVDTNTQLLDVEVVHKPKEIESDDSPTTAIQNNTTVFVGSTADLLKSLKSSNIIENK